MVPFLRRLLASRWLQVGCVFVAGLALRLIYVWQVGGTSLVLPEELDPGFYYDWARAIAAGDWLGKEPFVQSPLYAYLLGLFIKLFGPAVTPILVAQSIVGALTVLLTYLAGRRYFDHTRGLLSAGLMAFYGPFIFYEGQVMKTFLSPFLTILLALALHRARAAGNAEGKAPPAGPWILAGLLFGLIALDRDNFILLAPVLAILAVSLAGGLRRGGLRAAAALAFGAVVVIAPVTWRNWTVAKEFVLLTTGGGEVFFIGNNDDANGLYVPPPFVRPDPRYEHADFIARASEIAGRPLTPMQSSWFWFGEGVSYITSEPLSWLRLLWAKFVHFWNWYELPDNLDYVVLQWFSPLLDTLNATLPPATAPTLAVPTTAGWLPVRLHLYSTFGLVAPLGMLGLYLTRRRFCDLLPLHVLLFGYMGTVLLFFNFSRFRVPVVPLLALFAGEGLVAVGRGLRRAWDLAVAFADRSGDLDDRARALVPGRGGLVAVGLFALALGFVNVEYSRGVVPALEQTLVIGNAYYAQNEPEKARQSFYTGLVLLGEGPTGPAGDVLLRQQFGPGVTRERLLLELEAESIARGNQFKGIHVGIHHGLGISLLREAQNRLAQGRRQEALPLLDRALDQFKEALKQAPSYLLSHRMMSRAYLLKGESTEAREWLVKAVDLWPEDLQSRLELAEMLYAAGEFRRALKEIEAAVYYNATIEPATMAQIRFSRGLIFYRGLNDEGAALSSFEAALEIEPAHPQASAMRAAVMEFRARGVQPVPDEALKNAAAKGAATPPS